MNFKLLFGVLFILTGVSIILKLFFNVSFPVFKILFGVFLIAWGISILLGGFKLGKTDEGNAVFGSSKLTAIPPQGELNAVFGNVEIDLTTLTQEQLPQKIELNAVFGSIKLFVNDKLPYKIISNTVLGLVNSKSETKSLIGTSTYKSSQFDETMPNFEIKANAVLASIEIIERS